MLQNVYVVLFTCKDRRRYSRKRAKFFRKFAKKRWWSMRSPSPSCTRSTTSAVTSEASMKVGRAILMTGGDDLANLQNFTKFVQIFGGLVLGCIKTKFCKKICVWVCLTAFFNLYKMCTLMHRCDLKMLAKNRLEESANFVKDFRLSKLFADYVAKSAKI